MCKKSVSAVVLVLFFLKLKLVHCNDTIEHTLRKCLISQSPDGVGQCLGVGAFNKLRNLDTIQEFDLIDGVTLAKDGKEYREAYNFEGGDPSSFRSILDSVNHVFANRNLLWNMGFLYPGLSMRVAPSGGPGGQLEFVLDAHREALNVQTLKEAGTGRLLARQFLVPFLLGFKFNVASLLPIIFGLLALFAKKAVVISKLALIITSALGLGSLLFNSAGQHSQFYHGGGGGGGNGHYHVHPHPVYQGYRYPEEEYINGYYKKSIEDGSDQFNLHGDISKPFRPVEEAQQSIGRNFAWNEDEKKINEKT